MLGYHERDPVSRRAEAALTGGRFVKDGTGENQVLHCGDGEQALGVNKFDTALGLIATIHCDGDLPVTAVEAISVHDEVSSDANGKAQVANVGDQILGIALNATTADGDEVVVRMLRGTQVKA